MEQNDSKIVLSDNLSLTKEASQELLDITTTIEKMETDLKAFEELQIQYDNFRKRLFEAMTKYNVIKYVSLGGIQFTIVSTSPDKTEIVLKFNEEKFKTEKPAMYKKYLEQVEKFTKGKSSYLRITLPKGSD